MEDGREEVPEPLNAAAANAASPETAQTELETVERQTLDVNEGRSRSLRAAEGSGVQGWIGVEGAELPATLAVLGAGLPSGSKVAVADDGSFALPEAISGERYLIRLPAELVTSWSPTEDSVVGSSYVHLVAPARVDVYAQTLASALHFTLLLPGGDPAARRRAQVTLDGQHPRTLTVETDHEGAAFVPLPFNGWWTNARITPQPEAGVIYEHCWIARTDLAASGVAGACRMRRAASESYLFLDLGSRPVAGVRAALPSTSTISDDEGFLVLLKQDVDRVRWEHPHLEASTRSVSVSVARMFPIRMVPKGGTTWLCPDPNAPENFELMLIPGAYPDGDANDPRRRDTWPRSVHRKKREIDWRIENTEIAPGDGLALCWRGITYWRGPAEYGNGESVRSLPNPTIRTYHVTIYESDGAPAAGVRFRTNSGSAVRTDDAGVASFEYVDASGEESLWVEVGDDVLTLRYPFDANGRPGMPSIIRLPVLKPLLLRVVSRPPQVRSISLAIETEWNRAIVDAALSWSGANDDAGLFPIGRRLYRITLRDGVTIEAWHDTASGQALTIVLPKSEDR